MATPRALAARRDSPHRVAVHRVAVLLLPGTVPLNVAVPLEAFLRAGELSLPYDVRLCGSTATVGSFGHWTPDEDLEWAETADTVVVPGRYDVAAPCDPLVLDLLRRVERRGARLAATCGGAFVLAQAGILDGRRATSHWYRTDELQRLHPAVRVDARPLYVEDGSVHTGAGMAASLDLCVHLVRSDHGASAAARLARVLLVAPHREGGQAQFVETRARHDSGKLSELRAWLVENLDRQVALVDMASHARCSERTLLRQFRAETGQSPLQWLTARRVDAVRSLLETTRLSVEEIARCTGLGTGANLRQHLRASIGVGPREYRRTYQAEGLARTGR
jgi:transcriptional regulator GlxA family with amidase domain